MKAVWRNVGRLVGPRHIRRVALSIFVVLTLLGTTLLIAGQAPPLVDWSTDSQGETVVTVPEDSDGDGLPDALENLIGSDPDRFDTLGQDIPDGWIYHWYGAGVDWNDTSLLDEPALSPPSSELPEPVQRPNAISLPTVAGLFHLEDERLREDEGLSGAWWLMQPGLNPLDWDNSGDGVADAWLLMHGLHPLNTDVDGSAPGDPEMTIREKYDHGLDPRTRDSSGNGLHDAEALAGVATIAGLRQEFDPLDPARFSSRGDTIGDGYLIRFGLDPHDEAIASSTPAGDGITVQDAYDATREHCESEAADAAQTEQPECAWRERLEDGPLVDPTVWDSLGDGVPDAWALLDPHEIADPLVNATTVVRYDTEQWDESPWTGDTARLEGVVVDERNPQPDETFELTLYDLYSYQRPGDWDEETMGPWWGGLPTVVETPEGGLPPAVALRGWTIQVDLGLGGNPDVRTAEASADPRRADTSGDGLTDLEEYYGVAFREGDDFLFNRTNPSDPDTDGDGLKDRAEVIQFRTDPTRQDTSGSFLADGFEAEYWTQRYEEDLNAFLALTETDPVEAQESWSWLLEEGESEVTAGHFERLKPTGSLHGGSANILSASSSGDRLKDGEELEPNKFPPLGIITTHTRPETDPARVDTSGDRLPDEWKLRHSRDSVFDCAGACVPPVGGITGWPLDASKNLSVPLDVESDRDVNLAGDFVETPDGRLSFNNWLAYLYDLDPYDRDSANDGIPDMFAIHWGVENVPEEIQDRIRDDDAFENQRVWAEQAANRVASRLTDIGFLDRLDPDALVMIEPRTGSTPVGPETNLLELFDGRGKGTWVYVPPVGGTSATCDTESLPDTGPRAEEAYQDSWNGASLIPDRTGPDALVDLADTDRAACWKWIEHPLSEDVDFASPWQHDLQDEGLPDAWRQFYGMPENAGPGDPTPGSLDAGCDDSRVTAGWDLSEARDGFCLSWLETYQYGPDPNEADTDGGGLPDWQEIVLGLDPLDPTDDFIEEDWSGDGLPNSVKISLGLSLFFPDTVGSGLVDGDLEGIFTDDDLIPRYDHLDPRKGDGDLCLRRGDDSVPNMENRPAAAPTFENGSMSWTTLFEWYVDLGVVHFPDTDDVCRDHPAAKEGEPWYVFLREGVWDPEQDLFRGAGGGTDPHAWDTSGDGLPDGWLVYWRERAQQEGMSPSVIGALNPHADVAGRVPDEDFLSNREEYERNRPDDWNEGRDGIWWGGSSPIHGDTAGGAEEWFEIPMDARDLRNTDLDYDGIPDRYDPYPGLDTLNEGITRWAAGECPRPAHVDCYVTDFTRTWTLLAERRESHLSDQDGDRVPDFLDRGRIQITDVDIEAGEDDAGAIRLVQGGDAITITGRVQLDEPDPGEEWPTFIGEDTPDPETWANGMDWGAANLTVKAYVDDGDRIALVGFAFTDDNGDFLIQAAATPSITGPSAPLNGAALEGVHFTDHEAPISLAGDGHRLVPGPATLFLEIETNDPELQPIHFARQGEQTALASAFKEAPFEIPGRFVDVDGDQRAVGVEGLVIKGERDGQDPDEDQVHHATNAVFETRTQPVSIVLASTTHLDISPPSSVRTGETIVVTGALVNEAGTGLPERNVRAEITSGNGIVHTNATGEDGAFRLELPTDGLLPGSHSIEVRAVDWGEDALLDPPEDVPLSVVVTRDAHWVALELGGEPLQTGTQTGTDAAATLNVTARLVDHDGLPLTDQQVELELRHLQEGTIVQQGHGVTQEDGSVTIPIPPIEDGTPTGALEATLSAPAGDTQDHEPATWFILPRFHVALALDGTEIGVGQTGQLEGNLTRIDGGDPIHDPDAAFVIINDRGEQHLVTGTGPDGSFEVPVRWDDPEAVSWTARYIGSNNYHPSENATATSLHTSPTRIENVTGEGLRHSEVAVMGELRLADGRTAPGSHTVEARWADAPQDEAVQWPVHSGAFEGTLPPREKTGSHELVIQFEGDGTLHPVKEQTELDILAPTRLDLEAQNLTLPPDREAEPPFLEALLVQEHLEEDDEPLGGRTVLFTFQGPNGTVIEREVSTDGEGRMRVRALESGLELSGEWTIRAEYSRTGFEADTDTETTALLRHAAHVVLDRVPGSLNPGTEAPIVGHVKAPSNTTGPFEVTVVLDGRNTTTQSVPPDGRFSFRFPVPELPRGETTLHVAGHAGEHVEIEAAMTQVMILAPVFVDLTEEPLEEGARRIHVSVDAPPEARWEGGEVVLSRHREDGSIASTYRIPVGEEGVGQLDLSAREAGDIGVVAVLADGLRVTDPAFLEAAGPGTQEPGTVAWQVWAGSAALLVVVALGTSYAWWRHRQAQALRRSWERAMLALHDPNKSPNAVVRDAYQQLLDALGRTGYGASHRTVRDVTEEATRMFQLPAPPMEILSLLFERVAYAHAEIAESDRLDAIRAFEALYHQIPDPLRPKGVRRNPARLPRRTTHA